jgi:acylphosphatase
MFMDSMKLKVTITGENVHNVGYRYFLMTSAIDQGLDGFNARNTMKGNEQQVVALIEGNEEAIAGFKKLAESQRPEHSLVSSIVFEDTNSNVMKTGEYAQVCTAIQLNKAIPLLLDMRDDLKEMKGDMKEMKGDIKEMKGDMKEMKGDMKEMKGDMKEMKGDMKVVRKNTDIIPQIHEEIKGMREDIQPGYAAQFRLVQADIRAIKERLGMS